MKTIINESANKNTTWNNDNHAGTNRWSLFLSKIHILIINRYDSWHSLDLSTWELEDQNLRNTTKMAPEIRCITLIRLYDRKSHNKNASVYFITAALSYFASLTDNDANRVLYTCSPETVELEFIEGHDFLFHSMSIFRMTQRRIDDSSFRKFWLNKKHVLLSHFHLNY